MRTTMDSEDHYHSPYDTHELDSDQHYEAPTCLKRNPSGSLFIPSGEDGGQCDHIDDRRGGVHLNHKERDSSFDNPTPTTPAPDLNESHHRRER